MGLLDRIFGSKKQKEQAQEAREYFRLLNGYAPVFSNWGGKVYESELVRAAIDSIARHVSKLRFTAAGTAQPELRARLRQAPNEWQTWSQFLYRTATILMVKNTCFIVPVIDAFGRTQGIYTICPAMWELVQMDDKDKTVFIRFIFESGERSAIELSRVGIITRYQYKNDLFGEDNNALSDTMQLIKIQRQGIEEAAKNSASYRFMARVSNFGKDADLAKERQRFDKENFQAGSSGGGVLLMPTTWTDIKQLTQQSYTVDAKQMELIQTNVFNYYGVNLDVLQNKAVGDAWSAFYEGAVEPVAIQLSDVLTKMLFSTREQALGAAIYFTANRLQYMTNQDKLAVSADLLDRGIISINEARDIWNLQPVEGGDIRIIRGEYYDANAKLVDEDTNQTNEGEEHDNA